MKEGPFPSREAALAQHGGVLPLNTKLVAAKPRAGAQGEEWYLVGRPPGGHAAAKCATRIPARAISASGKPTSRCRRTPASASARITEANIGNKLAVVLDNQIVSVATIQTSIEDSGPHYRSGQRAGGRDLARYLRSGSLPASVKYLEENSVGPSLGADSIHEGITAGMAGLIAVIVVMLVYYKRSGVNAVLALMLNTVILLAAHLLFPRGADAAGHRRRDPDHRYGGGFERADLRAHPRGTAGRQVGRGGGGHRFR